MSSFVIFMLDDAINAINSYLHKLQGVDRSYTFDEIIKNGVAAKLIGKSIYYLTKIAG